MENAYDLTGKFEKLNKYKVKATQRPFYGNNVFEGTIEAKDKENAQERFANQNKISYGQYDYEVKKL